MKACLRAMAMIIAFIATASFHGQVMAQQQAAATPATPLQGVAGIKVEPIARWDVQRLDRILRSDTQQFSGVPVRYTPAQNAVLLYRVTYPSLIPERGNQPATASGLLAIPEGPGKSFPMVSYQHGTVYGRQEVPSFPEQSPETQLMIAQFAGQGYVVIGADYFGLGTSTEPEGYMVKGSHQQATYDLLMATRSVLAARGLSSDRLYLSGWSQGGFVTMAFLEKLEAAGIKVDAAATASAPLDVLALMQGFLIFPRKTDAAWLNSIMILSSFAYENYYVVPGLARSLLADAYYDVAKRAYDRQPFDPADIPIDLRKLIRPEYFDPQFFADSAFGRLISQAHAYRWVIRSPVRNYYGDADEAITVGVGRMAMSWAQAMGSGNPMVEAVSTGPTSHRGTFATAVPGWKLWFDGLR